MSKPVIPELSPWDIQQIHASLMERQSSIKRLIRDGTEKREYAFRANNKKHEEELKVGLNKLQKTLVRVENLLRVFKNVPVEELQLNEWVE